MDGRGRGRRRERRWRKGGDECEGGWGWVGAWGVSKVFSWYARVEGRMATRDEGQFEKKLGTEFQRRGCTAVVEEADAGSYDSCV